MLLPCALAAATFCRRPAPGLLNTHHTARTELLLQAAPCRLSLEPLSPHTALEEAIRSNSTTLPPWSPVAR